MRLVEPVHLMARCNRPSGEKASGRLAQRLRPAGLRDLALGDGGEVGLLGLVPSGAVAPLTSVSASRMRVLRLDGRSREPSEGPLHEWFCVFLDARAMRDDQLVEIP